MKENVMISQPYERANTIGFCIMKAVEAVPLVALGIQLKRGPDAFWNYVYWIPLEIFCLWCISKFFQKNSVRLTLDNTGIRIMASIGIINDTYKELFFEWQDLPNAYETHTQRGTPYFVISNTVYSEKELIKLCTKARQKEQLVFSDNDVITVVFNPKQFLQTPDEVKNFISQHSNLR